MKNKILLFFVLGLLFTPQITSQLYAQRPMEKLDRSVVAQKLSNGVFVNWRITSDEWYNTAYKLYRDGSLIYSTTTEGASNYLDSGGNINSKYSVSVVKKGVESVQTPPASVIGNSYLEIPLRDIKKLGKQAYYPNDATAADLDGDGQYEVIIKRMRRNWEATCFDYTYFEAYKLDGTFLWAIDVGPNITMDVEINIAAFDFDGDSKAEVFMRSSDNTIFGLDINNQNGTSVGDRNGDGYTNYRLAPFNGIGGDGFMNAGPEYLSLIDGVTGKELDWVNFIARGSSSDWGDDYGHRANKFFFGAPYLDGKKPSLFIGRGIYTQTKMKTYDVVNKKLVLRWAWESGNSTALQKGKWDDSSKSYFGQGYHNYTIADVDDDGKDEINWGSMSVDDDGKPLYSTELGHGDAQHYGDFDPYRKGQEMFACNESKPGTNLRDAKTGKILYRKVAASDVGRAGAGNISDLYKGAEVWGGGTGLSATDKVELGSFGVAENYCVYWDGDLCQEILDHTGFSSSTGVGYGKISKFNSMGNVSSLLTADAYSCNYTKGTPCLQADIMGDWREEAIWWRTDSLALRIYTTPYTTTNRIYTLMHDSQYRQAICWQMCGYNQPPHTGFYMGSDFPTPIPAKSTNGKLIFKGVTGNWDTSTANFMNGDDASGLIAGTSPAVTFTNGKSVMLDERSNVKNVNLNENLQPELLMVSGNDDYTISGSGILSGTMILDKLGESNLTITGNHTYTGKTDIWEGNLFYYGNLTASPVTIRRHAGFGGKLTVGNQITTEYNASVYPGGVATADTMKISGNLSLVNGARLVVDLSDNPTIPTKQAVRSTKKNDYLQIDGTAQLAAGSVVVINEIADSISEGKYLIMKTNNLTGNPADMKIQGAGGKSVSLTYDSNTKELFLVVVGTRSASSVVWTGKTNNVWDVGKSTNWSKDNYDDIFVNNDSVSFDNTGFSRSITVNDSVYISAMTVDNLSTKNYTFFGTGSLNGPMSLTKSGPGALYMNTRNSFTGKVVVNEGSLIMQYAPSSINNGGIGKNITDPAFLVLKDSSILQVTTANEQTNRGLTVAGEAGGIMNVSANLYWDGLITGTKLTKTGTGTLYIGSNNQNLTETILTAGTIKLNSDASIAYGVGKKIKLLAGTLDSKNSTGAYQISSHQIEVPVGCTASVVAPPRCEYNGILTGGGTLNWKTDYIRAYMNANWSDFSGNLNITANSANSTYEDHFIVNNVSGYPKATVNIGSGIRMCYKNGTSDNGRTKIKTGMLTGVAGSEFYNADLEVGATNTSGLFDGVIMGSTVVTKIGTGTWTLGGVNTYSGNTNLNGGTIVLNGSLTGTGTFIVATGTFFNVKGAVFGPVEIALNGITSLTGTLNSTLTSRGVLRGAGGKIKGNVILGDSSVTQPGSASIGNFSFGNTTMSSGATLEMQLNGGTTLCDLLNVTGTLTLGGTLNLSGSGVFKATDSFRLFNATTLTGTFTKIQLPVLENGLEWDLAELYTTGTIKVKLSGTGIRNPTINIGVVANPTNGLFRILVGNETDFNLQVIDLQGKIVYKSVLNSTGGEYDLDIRKSPVGIYLLNITSQKGYSNTLKLMKNR